MTYETLHKINRLAASYRVIRLNIIIENCSLTVLCVAIKHKVFFSLRSRSIILIIDLLTNLPLYILVLFIVLFVVFLGCYCPYRVLSLVQSVNCFLYQTLFFFVDYCCRLFNLIIHLLLILSKYGCIKCIAYNTMIGLS